MFLRLLLESFLRQKRRKALAGIAILLGTTAVTAMLALATTIGDRIHRELAVYGANIVVTPKAADLAVNIGGVDVQPATGGAYLHESDLAKLRTIFWANNITAISPELACSLPAACTLPAGAAIQRVPSTGGFFGQANDLLGTRIKAPASGSIHELGCKAGDLSSPWWKLHGGGQVPVERWQEDPRATLRPPVATRFRFERRCLVRGTRPNATVSRYRHTATSRKSLLCRSRTANARGPLTDDLSRIDISARTRPEDAFARQDPDTLSPKQRDLWYCRPYANSIAYQIREAIPNSDAQQVRRVEQTEGTVLTRISGLMWLVSAAALLAAGFAVSAAMATAVLERRGEIGLMRSLGAGKPAIASLFYAESAILATAAGTPRLPRRQRPRLVARRATSSPPTAHPRSSTPSSSPSSSRSPSSSPSSAAPPPSAPPSSDASTVLRGTIDHSVAGTNREPHVRF